MVNGYVRLMKILHQLNKEINNKHGCRKLKSFGNPTTESWNRFF